MGVKYNTNIVYGVQDIPSRPLVFSDGATDAGNKKEDSSDFFFYGLIIGSSF